LVIPTSGALFKINLGGVATLASGFPYNYTTGVNNAGDTGATTDRPVINGVVVGRNTGRGRAIYDFSPFVERAFSFGAQRLLWVIRTLSSLGIKDFRGVLLGILRGVTAPPIDHAEAA
jgi:hypothetical protein